VGGGRMRSRCANCAAARAGPDPTVAVARSRSIVQQPWSALYNEQNGCASDGMIQNGNTEPQMLRKNFLVAVTSQQAIATPEISKMFLCASYSF
jgi:hypothetical protein